MGAYTPIEFNKPSRRFTLHKRKPSRKDYDHFKSHGLAAAPLPDELLFLSPILNQGATQRCTAYSAVAIRQSMKGKEYDPNVYWADELQFMGVTDADGSDVETQLAVGRKLGFRWVQAQVNTDKASAYFFVRKSGGMDWFDAIRTTINQIQAPLSAGLDWYDDWDGVATGIVPASFNNKLGGHCVKIAGFKEINSIPYIVIQNSWGTSFGDNGLFYFSREMTNKVFGAGYGIGYWSDDPNVMIVRLGFLQALLQNVVALYQTLIGQKTGYPPPLLWDKWENSRHSVRVICDEEGLNWNDKNILCACVQVESNFNTKAVHFNKNQAGQVWSADYGIVQINDYWNIGPDKPFPSIDYVMQNPEASVRWMAKQWKAGNQHLWASYTSGAYKQYL